MITYLFDQLFSLPDVITLEPDVVLVDYAQSQRYQGESAVPI